MHISMQIFKKDTKKYTYTLTKICCTTCLITGKEPKVMYTHVIQS
uniref:Uncharacterized protein n=1 Tax=Arundo donax TaxID=35708 RepID=A0A0A9GB13_ARUDO